MSLGASPVVNRQKLFDQNVSFQRNGLTLGKYWDRTFTLWHNPYGFGWMALDDWYYHGGEYLGFYAEIFFHRETKVGKIMLYNLEAESDFDQLSIDEHSVWRSELVRVLQTH